LIPDAVLERYAVTGTPSEVVGRLTDLRQHIQPELVLVDADDYSVDFLERAAALLMDAGVVAVQAEV
jgi:hypothetical protein